MVIFLFFSLEICAASKCEPTNKGTEICSVQTVFSGQPREYQYEIKRSRPGSPTIIEIPGGPGQGYIGNMKGVAAGAVIPEEFGIISLDPRGVGKNDYGPDTKGGNYTSDLEVSDILTVIKQEQLNNYLVHGQSYGTLVATKLASKISSEDKAPKPRGLVLSGVVDKHFDDQLAGYNLQIQRILNGFDSNQKKQIISGLNALLEGPFKNNKNVFAGALINALLFNVEVDNSLFKEQAPNVTRFFEMLATGKIDVSNTLYSQMIDFAKKNAEKKFDFGSVQRKNTMSESIKCTELSKIGFEADVSIDLNNNVQFILLNSDCEKNGYKMARPYTSSDYQVTAIPIYYLQGNLDPATPAADAKSHYNNQNSTEKMYVELKGYSHTNLFGLSNCKTGLWEALAAGTSKLEEQIGHCADPNVKVLGSASAVKYPTRTEADPKGATK